ncbi:unnamed protein product [Fusarium equiseti]|uniref:Uncharacterized protein n=1 Tax=Fusarium equiseti TaxID=61235 RepID=A0A8J2NH42_FUSEQ|nr:unnamed protein product [Fusarium equiseti]
MKYLVKILGFALLFSTAAQAASEIPNAPQGAHYAQGSSKPTCTLIGLTVSCTGTTIQGVGNTNAEVELVVTTTFTGTCTNKGGNLVEPFTKSTTTDTLATVSPAENGNLQVPEQTATGTSSEDFLKTFKCPNRNWTPEAKNPVVSYTYTLTFAGFNDPAIFITSP